MSRLDPGRQAIFRVILLCGWTTVVVVASFALGARHQVGPLRWLVERTLQADTLGRLISDTALAPQIQPAQIRDAVKAYSPAALSNGVDTFSWDVANVPVPFLGSAPAPGQQHNAYINALQFRDRREVVEPDTDTYRIFLTGGSTAFGSGAPSDGSTIAAFLEAELNQSGDHSRRFEVFTFADPGWSSTHERIAIENRLSRLKPRAVVSLSGANDVFWSQRGYDIFFFRTFKEDIFWLLYAESHRVSGFAEPPDPVGKGSSPVSPPQVAANLERNVKLSSFALSLADADYWFFLQPILATTKKGLSGREKAFRRQSDDYFRAAFDQIDNRLKAAKIANFHYRNLSSVFDQWNEQEIFIDSFHFGDVGNKLIAKSIAVAIQGGGSSKQDAAAHSAPMAERNQ